MANDKSHNQKQEGNGDSHCHFRCDRYSLFHEYVTIRVIELSDDPLLYIRRGFVLFVSMVKASPLVTRLYQLIKPNTNLDGTRTGR